VIWRGSVPSGAAAGPRAAAVPAAAAAGHSLYIFIIRHSNFSSSRFLKNDALDRAKRKECKKGAARMGVQLRDLRKQVNF